MDDEDYFGDVVVPLDEEGVDAANDLTFGDIGDIKAGVDSHSAWNANHQTLSSKIEAEKDALYRSRYATHPPQPGTASQHANPPPVTQNHRSSPTQHSEPVPTPWELLKHSMIQHSSPVQEVHPMHTQLQNQHLPQSASHHVSPLLPLHLQPQPPAELLQHPVHHSLQKPTHQSVSQSMHHTAEQPVHPSLQQPLRQNLQQPLRQPVHQNMHMQHQRQVQQPSQQMTPQEYHHFLVSFNQQQTNLMLQQHQERRDKQLVEAERAQQAGIPFDREQFDRHQAGTRQMILTDHYARFRRVQYQAAQYQQQHLLRQTANNAAAHIPPVDPLRKINGVARPDSSLSSSMSPGQAPRNHGETSVNDARTLDPFEATLSNGHNSHRASVTNASRLKQLRDEDLEKAPRMLEIERQMAAAGLGPSTGSRDVATFGITSHRTGNGSDPVRNKTVRRLESMTDRDQELVFRAHLRQIETSVVYRDDYYNSILKRKEKNGGQEVFADLSERVHSMRLRGKERSGSKSTRIRVPKRSKADSQPPDSSPTHSDQNMLALANALGTVQSWNPRAPRRVMDFSLLEKRVMDEDDDPEKSLREDERVHVRQEVERGYDIIATIHDIARGENQIQTLAQSSETLMSTLHLVGKFDEDGKQRDHHESTRFFATMCIIPKGRRYLALVLELLDTAEKVRVMSAIFENLGMLVFATKKTRECDSVDGSAQHNLHAVMTKIVQDTELSTQDCMHLFNSFSSSHVPHRDAFLTTFRSAIGARLVFLCMQRVSAGLSTQKVAQGGLWLSHIENFTVAFTECVQGIFEGAESEGRVWEVVASLDALATGESRTKYRSELNRLLRAGAVPQPPS